MANLDISNGNIRLFPGTYQLRGQVPTAALTGVTPRPTFQWYDATNGAWLGSMSAAYPPGDGAGSVAYGGAAEAVITVTSTSNVQLRLRSSTGNVRLNSNGDFTGTANPWFTVSMPAGQTVVTNSLDYVMVKNSADLAVTANANIVFNTISGNLGGTLYNTTSGNFTLKANTTYRLVSSQAQLSSGSSFPFAWKWSANANYVVSQVNGLSSTTNPGAGTVEMIVSVGIADANVRLVVDGNNSGTIRANSGWAIAQAIGGAATTTNLTLTSNLTVGGVSNLGAVGNLIITGGNNGNVLTTYGNGTVFWGPGVGEWSSNSSWTMSATTTAPTMATTNSRNLLWKVDGKTLYIRGWYQATSNSGANAGNGEYLLPIPGGYTIDTTLTGTSNLGVRYGLGVGRVLIDNVTAAGNPFLGDGVVLVYNGTNLKFSVPTYGFSTATQISPVTSNFFAFNSQRYYIAFDAQLPIL
jgi:hypothetical protein